MKRTYLTMPYVESLSTRITVVVTHNFPTDSTILPHKKNCQTRGKERARGIEEVVGFKAKNKMIFFLTYVFPTLVSKFLFLRMGDKTAREHS